MAARYPTQTFELYQHTQWPVEPKTSFDDDDSVVLDEKVLDSTSPTDLAPLSDSRRASFVKIEDPYHPTDSMWHDRSQEVAGSATRHYSQPNVPYYSTPHQSYMRIDPNYAAAYTHPQQWPMSASSGTNTPTPLFMSSGYGQGQSMSYQGGPVTFTHIQHTNDPATATSMSPQSSQGGWQSTASSDSAELNVNAVHSPTYRPTSPNSALRPDGVRKKNARFEIPKERNLNNIDAMIMSTTDEAEKKELKQQKRLLRNRQAALDSRQRKKSHTEKLELEKKHYAQKQQELEEALQRAQDDIQRAQEEFMHQRQQYEHFIRQADFDRDEAIRTKTLETGELRRMNNMLKDHITDLERRMFSSTSVSTNAHNANQFTPDPYSFDNLGLDDTWEDFSLMDGSDVKIEHSEPHQTTPRPQSHPKSAVTEQKSADLSFSLNAFYMCLLFGAFIASNSNSTTTSTAIRQSIPALSDDYRAEAGNVLKAVLSSGPENAQSLIPNSHQHTFSTPVTSGNRPQPSQMDNLHSSLTTPSHHQQVTNTFGLDAESYNHMSNPDSDLQAFINDRNSDHEITPQPSMTRLQQAYANMKSENADIDRMLQGQSARRSLLWERVPEKVLKDFKEMVGMTQDGVQ